MKSYGAFERAVARTLESFPVVRNFAKGIYHRANYLCFGTRGFECALHPGICLRTPSERFNAAHDERESFFGYYDKSPWSPDMTRFLLHEVSPNRKVRLIIYDAISEERIDVATSSAWNYQQGSMAQWLPKSKGQEIIFNDYMRGNLVSRIVSVEDGSSRELPWPIQVVHPNGCEALTLNYCRLDALRPEYGYHVDANNFHVDQSLEDDGIWRIDLATGRAELRLTLAELADLHPREKMRDARHKVNHFCYSPSGRYFAFLHRWFGSTGKFSRLYVAQANVDHLKLLLDDRMVSHYSWKDDEHLLVWGRTREKGDRYYLINVLSGERKVIGEGLLDRYGDGHPSFSPDERWILTDSYPNKARQRHLLLFDCDAGELIELGRFFAPWKLSGVTRCDLHPRWSPDGKSLSIDSAHDGTRRSYIVDLISIVS